MGYNAFVHCNCYKDGKTSIPPYKKFVRYNEETGLYLDIPHKVKKYNDAYEMENAFWNWKKNACPHDDMELVSVRLCNVSGMAEFEYAIEQKGGKHKYPILTKYLPGSNDGIVPSAYAYDMLNEIYLFENEKTEEDKLILFEKTTNSYVSSMFLNVENEFIKYEENIYFLLYEDAFTITQLRDLKNHKIVFQSKNFTQTKISEFSYNFTDKETGKNFVTNFPLYETDDLNTLEFAFKKETLLFTYEYNYMIKALKQLINASIETGNPICWC